MNKLESLTRQLYGLEPTEPKMHMLRAVLEHELEQAFENFKELSRQTGVRVVNVTPNKAMFAPFLTQSQVKYVMRSYGTKNNKFPVRLPPKYWGVHFIDPASSTTPEPIP